MAGEMTFDNGPFNEDVFMQDAFLELKKKHKIKLVIETGTYHGTTTEWLAKNFKTVYTVEVNKEFAEIAAKTLSKYKNCHQFLGNSVDSLEFMLTQGKPDLPKLVFLDAHWYANPLLGELEVIAACGIKPVLVIHDFYNPFHPDFGYDVYPDQKITYNFEYVSAALEKIYGKDGFKHWYNQKATGAKRGCLFVTPKD